jgi:hypothetical protein
MSKPKPKFRVGQVVRTVGRVLFEIEEIKKESRGYRLYGSNGGKRWQPFEIYCRKLTAREIGPRTKDTEKPGKRGR